MLPPYHFQFALEGAIVYSPGNMPCVVHDVTDDLIEYQCIDEVHRDSETLFYPEGKPLIRTMDLYTFCEWFTLDPSF